MLLSRRVYLAWLLRRSQEQTKQCGPGQAEAEGLVEEVGETPYCRTKMRSWSSTLPGDYVAVQKPKDSNESMNEDHETESRVPSSQPPASAKSNLVIEIDRAASPLPVREQLTADQAALTWQEDEITGHDIDPAGDDDGEGINGIGFRPTPAIAHARQQRRKQQVNEWKARESRDARQRRIERRRGERSSAVGSTEDERRMNTGPGRRTVRFTGVG